MIRSFPVLLLGLGLTVMGGGVVAQQPERVPVIGFLITHPPVTDPVVENLREGLRKYGYEDGRNIKLDVRTALGQLDRVPALAAELVHLRVDVIVVVNDVAVRAVRQATSAIPIVMVGFTDDPLSAGWIESYSHPGGNLTGIFTVNSALAAKRLEILKETLPSVSRVAVLWDPSFGRRDLDDLQRAAPLVGVQVYPIEVRGPEDLDAGFETARRKKAGAVMLPRSPVFYVHRVRIAALALEAGLPTVADTDAIAQAGSLFSYGSTISDNVERAGYFIDRLLRGTKAADLPVEQASKFKLVVNLKTAKALGVRIPESILLRADEVIR
jgi:putative ABC transport system substrate-binding protein